MNTKTSDLTNMTFQGTNLGMFIMHKKCEPCNGVGYTDSWPVWRCSYCGTEYISPAPACSNSECSNFGILVPGGLPRHTVYEYCTTCNGTRYTDHVVWVKTYTLTVSKGTGVANVVVKRTSTQNPNASTGTLSSGAAIYAGDTLTVTATASSGYTLNSYTTNYTVSGNTSVSVTASLLSLGVPTITFTKSSGTVYCTIKNNNPFAVTIYVSTNLTTWTYYQVAANGLSEPFSFTILNDGNPDGEMVFAYASANGLNSSYTYTTVINRNAYPSGQGWIFINYDIYWYLFDYKDWIRDSSSSVSDYGAAMSYVNEHLSGTNNVDKIIELEGVDRMYYLYYATED